MDKRSIGYQNKLEYIRKYNAENCVKKMLQFNKLNKEDMEILEFMENNKPYTTYIKQLIKEDMMKKQR